MDRADALAFAVGGSAIAAMFAVGIYSSPGAAWAAKGDRFAGDPLREISLTFDTDERGTTTYLIKQLDGCRIWWVQPRHLPGQYVSNCYAVARK